jgi:deoxycytidine triphosphate deaminase/guanylate kinase
MKTIVVLVGLRGAGKSTLLRRCATIDNVVVLQPSTTRAPRSDDGDQYDYQDIAEWQATMENFAWTISVGAELYGMRLSQLASLPAGLVGLTVFYPGQIDVLYEFKSKGEYEVITVGLDTIGSHQELQQRIDLDPTRDEGPEAFERQRNIVQKCDAVLSGNADTVLQAFTVILNLIQKRGVLDVDSIRNLIKAGSLLTNALPNDNTRSASYDLRLGENFWSKGLPHKISADAPLFIPPYSYVIVEAMEEARLPRFIVARYDLTVSLFLDGIILSNGPQVDPGYEGGLLCMLFNGSDKRVGIRYGEHFATIEFLTTAKITPGYTDHHQHKKALLDFMSRTALGGPGGTILDRFEALAGEWASFRREFLWGSTIAILGIIVATFIMLVTVIPWAYDTVRKAQEASDKADNLVKVDALVVEQDNLKHEVEAELQQLKNSEQTNQASSSPRNTAPVSPNAKQKK